MARAGDMAVWLDLHEIGAVIPHDVVAAFV